MNKILIIYPHFPPSNLAGVHRPRLFATHLPAFNWEPILLTVHEKYYEEKPDWNLVKLIPADLRIIKVNAMKITKPRIIGDIGIRGFFQLYKAAKQIILNEKIDFLYIPVPSFYVALLGRWLNMTTGIRYGIDYIDPWVHQFPGSNKFFSRHWLSTKLAGTLERIAVKNAELITGVAAGYYEKVLERNPHLRTNAVVGAMPYGGEMSDHSAVSFLNIKPYLFARKENKLLLVYAGAMLPKAYKPLKSIFRAIKTDHEIYAKVEFHFVGTGKTPDDINGFNIKSLAEQYGLWNDIVFEHPRRIPYLDVLVHLEQADGIFILGSTEPHYTPSKVYQGVLSNKPVFAVLHHASTASAVLEKSRSGIVLNFNGEEDVATIEQRFTSAFQKFRSFINSFSADDVDKNAFSAYSAKSVTEKLAGLLNRVLHLKPAKGSVKING